MGRFQLRYKLDGKENRHLFDVEEADDVTPAVSEAGGEIVRGWSQEYRDRVTLINGAVQIEKNDGKPLDG